MAFLDRDGVVNIEKNYLYKKEEFKYVKGCIEGLKRLQCDGFKLVIITNQSGIARGFYTQKDYQELTDWYLSDLKNKGIDILDVYHCPHHINGVVDKFKRECNCRKPKTGMLERAIHEHNINIEKSILIGDKESDILAGKSIGLAECYLVTTGHEVPNDFTLCPIINTLEDIPI
ncbi:D-glycero-alpha-D-manno-heptose-1,7-bisphosphate 7-phosphatase [Vibrio nigripulchritudo]|uniref:D-glycero-alpha-D-manno-heptose-1,7-bisphosphate 7-phosphatase n=1 Tax=Vibrio nigripulchritudo TaxID=28173 RepID=UPI001F305BB4|nr:HAD family hydrolase [Vibrio nigripulchritudo]